MIQFSRQVAKQLRVVLRKMFGRNRPDVRLVAGPEGLRFQAKGHTHAVEYHDPEPREQSQLVIPYALLDDVQGTKSASVHVHCLKKKALAATWEDGGVERAMPYAPPKADETKFHDEPVSFASNPPGLLQALYHASKCTDVSSSRYALGCLQFLGNAGQIAATDGKQLLLQSGFTFGFQDELLVPSTEVFSCPELPQDQAVQIGKTDTHVVLRVGPWTFYLDIQKEGRFPRVGDIIPSTHSAQTTLVLHPDDAQFFKQNISRLPGNAESQNVTFDCNGTIAVRAKTEDTQPVEIVFTNSTKSGSDVTICLDRRNLASVASMGFDRVYLFGNQNAVLARDDNRNYLFMPLHEQNAIKSSKDCLSIPSPVSSGPSHSRRIYPRPYTPTPTMPTNRIRQTPATAPVTNGTGQETNSAAMAEPIRRRRRKSSSSSVLEQAVTLRDQLREVLSTTKELVRALKAERRSQKSLKIALDSLKLLQAAA